MRHILLVLRHIVLMRHIVLTVRHIVLIATYSVDATYSGGTNATKTVFLGCDWGVQIFQPNLFRLSSGKKESAPWDEYI